MASASVKWFPKLAAFLIALPVLFEVFFICRDRGLLNPMIGAGFMHDSSQETFDNLHLTPDLKEKSCLSRDQAVSYNKSSPHKPSYHLVNKLQEYEKLHKRCGPYTNSYNISVKEMIMSLAGHQIQINNSSSESQCKYVVWVAKGGLGNRILTITSAFLYALLTNRVLLINQEPSMVNLFCEPFPDASWLLPKDFPLKDQLHFTRNHAHTYGNLLKASTDHQPLPLPSYLCMYLACDYDNSDKLFFCDQDQTEILRNIPWLIMKSDSYYIPALFLMSSFAEELNKLFPDKETVFHHLGRYLFYPSNQVWKLITGYYDKYLAEAKERIGIQIRTFNWKTSPFQLVMDQILTCTTDKEKLLPRADMGKSMVDDPSVNVGTSKAVLITSLIPDYFNTMKGMYSKHPTLNGEVIAVYQPSLEGRQKSKNNLHNQKAWAEIYLLSMMDVLVTSARSTFGYVAQGLAGKKPWILHEIENRKFPEVVCSRAMSMEPCFHCPPFYDCKKKSQVHPGTIFPHLRHCEDVSGGIKLFNAT